MCAYGFVHSTQLNSLDVIVSVCPGKAVAEEVLFLSISRILTLFNISPTTDVDGNLKIPKEKMRTGGIV